MRATLAVVALALASSGVRGQIAGNDAVGTTDYPQGGMRRVAKLTMSDGLYRSLYGGVYDGSRYAYFGTAAAEDPGWVIKVDLAGPEPVEVGAARCHAGAGEFNLDSAAIDTAAGYAYFGSTSAPAKIVKIKLDDGTGQPVCLGSTPLGSGENGAFGLVIDTTDPDPANHFLLAGTATSPGIVVKLAPGVGDGLPVRLGAVTLNGANGENALRRVVLDTRDPLLANHAAIFATIGLTTVFVKVAFGAGNNPVRIGATTADAGDHAIGSAVIDQAHGLAYFGTYQTGAPSPTARVIRVALNAPDQPPARIDHLPLASGEIQLCSAVIDANAGIALFGTDHVYPADIYKIDLRTFHEMSKLTLVGGSQPNPPNGVNKINLPETSWGEVFLQSAVSDAGTGYAYFGTDSSKGQVVKTAMGPKGAVKAIRIVLGSASAMGDVNFYAHAGSGNVRLGIYDDGTPKRLLWQSPPLPAAEGWMTEPIAAGLPASLNLPAGTYWLAWQIDVNDNVASYSPGAPGDGWTSEQPTGPLPSAIGSAVSTSESWSLYADTCAPLDGPGNSLHAAKGSGTVDLSWDAGAGASAYRLLRCDGSAGCNPAPIASPAATHYEDPVLADSANYFYLAVAVNSCATAP